MPFPHTSDSLQKQYPEIYQEFFAQHDLVVSGQYCFNRFPSSVGERNKFIFEKSKLPLKIYVGIKKSDTFVGIDNIYSYSINEKRFISQSIEQILLNTHEANHKISNLLGANNQIQINILAEVQRGHGLGFTGTLCACLSKALHSYLKLDENIKTFGRELSYILKNGHSGGDTVLECFEEDSGPMIYQTINQSKNGEIPSKLIRFDDIAEYKTKENPLDYAIIYSGLLMDTQQIDMTRKEEVISEYRIYHDFYDSKISSDQNDYIKDLFDEKNELAQIIDGLSILSVRHLYLFKKLLEPNSGANDISNFIQHINQCANLLEIIEGQDLFFSELKNYFIKKGEVSIGLLPVYSGSSGGSYLLMMKKGHHRHIIESAIEELSSLYKGIFLQHASWREKPPYQTVLVDQHISEGVYSNFIKEGYVVYKDHKGESMVGNYSDLLKKYSNGILLDEISNKVYSKGRKLTKGDLKSQSTTIEVVGALIKNGGKPIHNLELPPSTYTRQQNQMLGKILGPLRKLVLSEYDKEFNISANGSLRDFEISLGENSFDLGIITKL